MLINKKADGTIIDEYSYIYDGAHNQKSKTDKKGTTEYTYDSLNRLETVKEPAISTSSTSSTNSTSNPTETITKYTYDRAGNRLTEVITKVVDTTAVGTKVTIYDYNEQNRLTTTTAIDAGATKKVTFTYDNNGNMLCSATTEVKTATPGTQASVSISTPGQSPTSYITFNQYNAWNQLVKTTEGNNTVTTTYYGDGLRATKTVNGETKRYLYEYDHVVLELDGQGNESARNIYEINLLQRTDNGQTYYYMYNGHGDVTALITADGQIPATYYYDAFGNIIEETVTGEVYQPFKYAGYIYDDETGYYYLNARYYDPVIARFLSEDTYRGQLNDPLSLNLYTYCHNEPIMYVDPSGHLESGERFGLKAKSDDVKQLQRKLNELGYRDKDGHRLVVDGDFGDKTLAALNKFKDDKLPGGNKGSNRGVVGETTWTSLGLKLETKKQTNQISSRNGNAGNTYVVRPGDSLSAIAKNNNTTINAIAQANGLLNPNLIQPGQRLIIAGPGYGTQGTTPPPKAPAQPGKNSGNSGNSIVPTHGVVSIAHSAGLGGGYAVHVDFLVSSKGIDTYFGIEGNAGPQMQAGFAEQVGAAWNVQKPSDYTGPYWGGNASGKLGPVGAAGSVSGSKLPDGRYPVAASVGPAQGAGAGASGARGFTFYLGRLINWE